MARYFIAPKVAHLMKLSLWLRGRMSLGGGLLVICLLLAILMGRALAGAGEAF